MALIGKNAREWCQWIVLASFFPYISVRIDIWVVWFPPIFLSIFQNALFVPVFFFTSHFISHYVLVSGACTRFHQNFCAASVHCERCKMSKRNFQNYSNSERYKWKINMKCACVVCIAPADLFLLTSIVTVDGARAVCALTCCVLSPEHRFTLTHQFASTSTSTVNVLAHSCSLCALSPYTR